MSAQVGKEIVAFSIFFYLFLPFPVSLFQTTRTDIAVCRVYRVRLGRTAERWLAEVFFKPTAARSPTRTSIAYISQINPFHV